MKSTAEIVQFQKKSLSEFICSACGADRGCDCNAPAIERLAHKDELSRQKQKAYRERKKQEKSKTALRNDANDDPIEEDCDDCTTNEERWERSVSNMASDAISLNSYWSRQFGDWKSFPASPQLVRLAKQAAEAWAELANIIGDK